MSLSNVGMDMRNGGIDNNYFIFLYLVVVSQQFVAESGEDKSAESSTKWQMAILFQW